MTASEVSGSLGSNSKAGPVYTNPTAPIASESTPTLVNVCPTTIPAESLPSAPVYCATRIAPAVVNPPATATSRKMSGKARLSAPTASAESRPR